MNEAAYISELESRLRRSGNGQKISEGLAIKMGGEGGQKNVAHLQGRRSHETRRRNHDSVEKKGEGRPVLQELSRKISLSGKGKDVRKNLAKKKQQQLVGKRESLLVREGGEKSARGRGIA